MPNDNQQIYQGFIIPQKVLDKYPELVKMLKVSESIDDDEKKYWFGALETMNEEQVQSLREILLEEQEQLKNINKQYQKNVKKTLSQAEIAVLKKNREIKIKKRREAEKKSKAEDSERTEELLDMLENL